MRDYQIITDSTCDLSGSLIHELDVHVIPMEFFIDGKSYLQDPEESELSSKEFYDFLRKGKTSTTSMINTETFNREFRMFLDGGLDIIYISFSSGLSGTYNAARLSAEELKEQYPGMNIILIDSLAASIGLGLLVYTAATMKTKGLSISDLQTWLEAEKHHVCHWFTVEDLHHLKRGGRISSVSANVGTALKIKPLLNISMDGKLTTRSRVIGRKKSLNHLIEQMKSDSFALENQSVFIGHGDSYEDALYVEKAIKAKFGVKEVIINFIGPIIGTHTGPGFIGLAFYGNKEISIE